MTALPETRTPRLRVYDEQPEATRAMHALDRAASAAGLDGPLMDLIRLRASQINGCAYCVDMHSKDLRRGGAAEERVHGVVVWRELPHYTARERAALALTEAVTLIGGGVPDDVYEDAARQFEPRELAALIWNIVAINAWNRLAIPTGDPVPGTYEPRPG